MGTYTEYAAEDGRVGEDTAGSYATIRGDIGGVLDRTADNAFVELKGTTNTNEFSPLNRTIFVWNTSSIPDGATLSSGSIYLYAYLKNNGVGSPSYNFTGCSPADEASIAMGDYDSFADTELATAIAYADIVVGSPYENIWTLNASGLAYIDKTGNTCFMLRDSWDIANSFGGSWASLGDTYIIFRTIDNAGTTYDPVLTIEYTEGGTTHAVACTTTSTAGTTLKINYDAAGATTITGASVSTFNGGLDSGIGLVVAGASGTTLNGELDNSLGLSAAAGATITARLELDNGLWLTAEAAAGTVISLTSTPAPAAGTVALEATVNGVSTTVIQLNADRALSEIVAASAALQGYLNADIALGQTAAAIAGSVIYLNPDYALGIEVDAAGGTTLTLTDSGSTASTLTASTDYWFDRGRTLPGPRHGIDQKHAPRYRIRMGV
jgi:hypothetical protein